MIRRLSVVGKSDLEKVIVKATFDDEDPPKEKHVKKLIYLSINEPECDILVHLLPRLRGGSSGSWRIVLKTLIIIHRLLRDGHPAFLHTQLSKRMSTIDLQHFRNLDPRDFGQCSFIKCYANYVVEHGRAYQQLSAHLTPSKVRRSTVDGDRPCCEPFYLTRLASQDSQKVIQGFSEDVFCLSLVRLLGLFSRMLVCKADPDNKPKGPGIHPIIANAIANLGFDALQLYGCLTSHVMCLVGEKFVTLNSDNTQLMVECCTTISDINRSLRNWVSLHYGQSVFSASSGGAQLDLVLSWVERLDGIISGTTGKINLPRLLTAHKNALSQKQSSGRKSSKERRPTANNDFEADFSSFDRNQDQNNLQLEWEAFSQSSSSSSPALFDHGNPFLSPSSATSNSFEIISPTAPQAQRTAQLEDFFK